MEIRLRQEPRHLKKRRYPDHKDWTVEEDTILRSLMYRGLGGQNSTYIAAAMTDDTSKRRINNCNRQYTGINVKKCWQQLKGPNPYPPGWQQPGFRAAKAKGLETRRAAAASEADAAPDAAGVTVCQCDFASGQKTLQRAMEMIQRESGRGMPTNRIIFVSIVPCAKECGE